MMITPEYCVAMARYNAWQNKQLKAALDGMTPEELVKPRGAFFGSIQATVNHLLWADGMWMSRVDGGKAPGGGIAESVDLCARYGDWTVARFRMDARILLWAEAVHAVDLTGALSWYSGALGREISKPRALCIMHMFNHQVHHRGQVHAMLTAAGAEAPVTDLPFMPETGPWL